MARRCPLSLSLSFSLFLSIFVKSATRLIFIRARGAGSAFRIFEHRFTWTLRVRVFCLFSMMAPPADAFSPVRRRTYETNQQKDNHITETPLYTPPDIHVVAHPWMHTHTPAPSPPRTFPLTRRHTARVSPNLAFRLPASTKAPRLSGRAALPDGARPVCSTHQRNGLPTTSAQRAAH
jgi:hypothetical protein